MRKLNLCIDIDGTITEPYYWLERANKYFKKNAKPKDVNCYAIHKVLGIEREDYNRFYELYGKALHRESAIRKGASEVINKLYDDYHEIHIVTAREQKMEGVSIEWLNSHRIPIDSISLLGCTNKVGKAIELQSDIFIEDSYDNAVQLAEAGFEVLLIDCSYNKGKLPPNVTRVNNWFQIARIVDIQATELAGLKVAL